jgi:hypothetical protein
MNEDHKREKSLREALFYWEGFDPQISAAENFNELQIQMGMLDEAKQVLHNVMYPK